jgi:hypothetical protein
LAILFVAAAGAFVLALAEKDSSFSALEAKVDLQPTPLEETKQAIAELRAAEDVKGKLLTKQLDALAARIDNLERARAEIAEPATRRDAETLMEPTTKGDGQTLRQRRHRKIGSFNSRRQKSGWQLFGSAP